MHTLRYFQSGSPGFCIFTPHPRQAPINLKSLNIDKLKSEYQELSRQKNELTATYKNCEKEVRELKRKLENLNQYLGRETIIPKEPKDKQKSL